MGKRLDYLNLATVSEREAILIIATYLRENPIGGGSDGTYIPKGVTTSQVGGIALGTNLGTDPILIQDIMDMEFYPTVGPTTTISASPAGGIYEKGNDQASVDLSSTTTRSTNPIVSFLYSKSGAGVIYTDPSPNPNGGSEAYTDSAGVSANTVYTAVVSDGTNTAQAITSFTFVSAYYYGVHAQGLNIASNGGGLTKAVISNSGSVTELFSPSNNVPYFCYPDSYAPLTRIEDVNGFNTILNWTHTSGVSVTNSFGDVQTYHKYEFKLVSVTVDTQYTFIQ